MISNGYSPINNYIELAQIMCADEHSTNITISCDVSKSPTELNVFNYSVISFTYCHVDIGIFLNSILSYFSNNYVSNSSSYGDYTIGHIKPDIVAPGIYTFSSLSNSTSCNALHLNTIDPNKIKLSDISLLGISGTSMATPNVNGSTTLIRQYYREGFHRYNSSLPSFDMSTVSSSLVKATLINNEVQMNNMNIFFFYNSSSSCGWINLNSMLSTFIQSHG